MLKSVLSYLLTNQQNGLSSQKDVTFRIDILKNRVDQLVVENESRKKEIEVLKEFKNEVMEVLDKNKLKNMVVDQRMGKVENGLGDLEKCILGAGGVKVGF